MEATRTVPVRATVGPPRRHPRTLDTAKFGEFADLETIGSESRATPREMLRNPIYPKSADVARSGLPLFAPKQG